MGYINNLVYTSTLQTDEHVYALAINVNIDNTFVQYIYLYTYLFIYINIYLFIYYYVCRYMY